MTNTLEPASIAIIGATEEKGKIGQYILTNILTQGYKGAVFPVNPNHETLMGKQTYASILDIPTTIDMAIIVTPASTVVHLTEQCAKKGVQTLVIISAGFAETGTKEGREEQRKIRECAQQSPMRIIGPNCLGFLRPSIGLNASFADSLPDAGSIALISQSGAMAVALMDKSKELSMGFSFIASIGNKADMDECDMLELAERDERTKVIGLYLENITDGKRMMRIARRITKKKPIVLMKSGMSQQGEKAIASHTGNLAGSSQAIDALCKQANIHRAKQTEECLDLLRTLSAQPPLLTNSIAIITNAGGPSIMATDAAQQENIILATLSKESKKALQTALPSAASIHNPIDILGDAREDRYAAALEICARDPSVDGIVVILTPQIMTPSLRIASIIATVARKHPLIPIVASFMGGAAVRAARTTLHMQGIPTFATPESAIHALASLQREKDETGEKKDTRMPPSNQRQEASSILRGQHGLLSQRLTEELCALYNIPLPKQYLATSAKEAAHYASETGYPVILKISSPDIIHKTDVGGVSANIENETALLHSYDTIMQSVGKNAPKAVLHGIMVQQCLPIGYEFIVGGTRDPSFGPLILVGLGGIYTELFRDTTCRIAPVSIENAYTMLGELQAWQLLKGMRGKSQADIDMLASVIVAVARMMEDNPSIDAIDLNPVLICGKTTSIADAKIFLQDLSKSTAPHTS